MTQWSQFQALAKLATLATALTGAKLKLGQGDTGILTDLADSAALSAKEADFDGYVEITLGAPLTPYEEAPNLYSMQISTVQFNWVHVMNDVENEITFAWIETAGGDVLQMFTFPEAVPMTGILSSLPIDLKFSESTLPVS